MLLFFVLEISLLFYQAPSIDEEQDSWDANCMTSNPFEISDDERRSCSFAVLAAGSNTN